jgi:putative ABC transport system permease protein
MIPVLALALRSIQRNGRRSIGTLATIIISAAATLSFAGFVYGTTLTLETLTVRVTGHLEIYRKGYKDFGTALPGVFSLPDYPALLSRLNSDPQIRQMSAVITPAIYLNGLASASGGESRTFFGIGFEADALHRLNAWDQHRLRLPQKMPGDALQSDDARGLVIGEGLARVLGLCKSLGVPDCPQRPAPHGAVDVGSAVIDTSLLALSAQEGRSEALGTARNRPALSLLSSTIDGAPNLLDGHVLAAQAHPVVEMDDIYVAMPFDMASELLFGGDGRRATAIILQLHETGQTDAARSRLQDILRPELNDLEIRDFEDLVPMYKEAAQLLRAIFAFVAAMLGCVVLFSVWNTMSMTIIERTAEIGTLRALGVKRSGIVAQFVVEGALLGAIGATLGLVLGAAIALAVNAADIALVLPGQGAGRLKLELSSAVAPTALGSWLGFVAIAALASVAPAWRAAQMKVVEAIRHGPGG